MTRAKLISMINSYVRNSAVDSYTNLRLNAILLAITGSGVSAVYDTFDEFQAAYESDTATGLKAFVADAAEYGFQDVILEYLPGVGVMVGGLQLIIDLR